MVPLSHLGRFGERPMAEVGGKSFGKPGRSNDGLIFWEDGVMDGTS